MTDTLRRAADCFERGALKEADQLCCEFLKISPHEPSAYVLLGRVSQALGNTQEAQAAFQRAVEADPTFAEGWLRSAKLLQAGGQGAKAEECLRTGLTHAPNSIALRNDFALLMISSQKYDDASEVLRLAIEIAPNSEISWFNLGILRGRQRRSEDSIAAYRRVIEINPNIPEAHNNLGDAVKEHDLEAAADYFRAALALRPDYPEALDNLGVILFFKGLLSEALDKFEHAVRLKPDFQRAIAHQTTALFLAGRLPEAWRLYRQRYVVAGIKHLPHGRFNIPVWNGECLEGKALLIWTELGLGEEILQAGMFSNALAVASKVTVECSPRLEALFVLSFPGISFIPRINPSRTCTVQIDADYQIAGGDLGGIFRGTWGEFPSHSGYLIADSGKSKALRKKYQGSGRKLVVGIAWASGQSNIGQGKTMALEEFSPLLRQPDVTFVNLQYAAKLEDVAEVNAALGIEIISDETIDHAGDMDAVAAQVAAMDLVISVSNTTVHMAGALNVPVWNIVPAHNASGLWHWFSDTEKSAWYPTMKIVRRAERTSDALMAQLATALKAVIASHMKSS